MPPPVVTPLVGRVAVVVVIPVDLAWRRVGLGAAGSATLLQLARRGLKVCGIDRARPPHALGSTHGESRVTREGIGEGLQYVPLARRSHELWRVIEAEVIPACTQLGMGQIVWSPMAQGVLSGKYLPGQPPPPGSRFREARSA